MWLSRLIRVVCLLICLVGCSDDKNVGVEVDVDLRPVWVVSEGYGDEHFYSLGIFGGNLGETISEKVNGAQIDAINKLKVQLRRQVQNIIYTWADTMSAYQNEHISQLALEQAIDSTLNVVTKKTFNVESWTDPKTNDLYVLLRLHFDDLVMVMKDRISNIIAEELRDYSRQGHNEFGRQISRLRRYRLDG